MELNHRGPPVFPGQIFCLSFFMQKSLALNSAGESWVKANHIPLKHHSRSGIRSGFYFIKTPALHAKIIQTIHGMTGIESKTDVQSRNFENTRLSLVSCGALGTTKLLKYSEKAINS